MFLIFALRQRRNLHAFCLGVSGFVNPPISQSLAHDLCQSNVAALVVFNAKRLAVVVTEIEFLEVAVKMLLAAMLVNGKRSTRPM
jgi:hypothetical protein